jgi:hypothetical protein
VPLGSRHPFGSARRIYSNLRHYPRGNRFDPVILQADNQGETLTGRTEFLEGLSSRQFYAEDVGIEIVQKSAGPCALLRRGGKAINKLSRAKCRLGQLDHHW